VGLWTAPFDPAQAVLDLEERAANRREAWRNFLSPFVWAFWMIAAFTSIVFICEGYEFVKKDCYCLNRSARFRKRGIQLELWLIYFTQRNLIQAFMKLEAETHRMLTEKQVAARGRSPSPSGTLRKLTFLFPSRTERLARYQRPIQESKNGSKHLKEDEETKTPTPPATILSTQPMSVRGLEDAAFPLSALDGLVPRKHNQVLARMVLLDLMQLGKNSPITGSYHHEVALLKKKISQRCGQLGYPYTEGEIDDIIQWLVKDGLVEWYKSGFSICLIMKKSRVRSENGLRIFQAIFSTRPARQV